MKVNKSLAKVARKLGYTAKKKPMKVGAAILAGSMMFCGSAQAQETVALDNFNDLELLPFNKNGAGNFDPNCIWTQDIRTGTDREWTLDNSGMTGETSEGAYFGWSAMNVDGWTAEQGIQLGRTNLGGGTGNTALVSDPDAWDDFTLDGEELGYNSFISRNYDLANFDINSLEISFDYEFASYDVQLGTVDVSFDGGNTFTNLLTLDSGVIGNSVLTFESVSFNAGSDFNPTSDQMTLRIGCTNADNDWWFAMDNIMVTTGDGFLDLEDFEGLQLDPFDVAILPDTFFDGTDWTQDIPNWTIDNSGNLAMSNEPAYDGWVVWDVGSWIAEQGGPRTLFTFEDPRNQVLLCDGDAFADFAPDLPALGINAFISRTYNLAGFDSSTVSIQFEYEFNTYDLQTGLVDVSFDNGNTFTNLLTLDSSANEPSTILANLAQFSAGQDFPAVQASSMTLRFGYTMADNDWWFAVDNILIQAEAGEFLLGDVNCDGNVDLLDVSPFVDLLINGGTNVKADINQDGFIDLLDVSPFVDLLTG